VELDLEFIHSLLDEALVLQYHIVNSQNFLIVHFCYALFSFVLYCIVLYCIVLYCTGPKVLTMR
jgi:hypothetical protein